MGALLVAGGTGLLGINWATQANKMQPVMIGTHSRQINFPQGQSIVMNYEDINAVYHILEKHEIHTVVNAIGLTDVENCESNPKLAHHVNVLLAENLAKATNKFGAKLIHISSDHLFNGMASMYDENSSVTPLNVYAQTKAYAEQVVMTAHPGALVIRTNFYGWGTTYRHSFSDRILKALYQGHPIGLFEDVYYTPILMDVLIDTAHQLLDKSHTGIFNVVGDERLSKFEFGILLAKEFDLDPTLIKPARLAERKDLTMRPFDMSLSNQKVVSCLGKNLGSVKDHLKRFHFASQRPIT